MSDQNSKEINIVALYSSKNLFKYGLGDLSTGYNIVSKEDAEKWTLHRAVRIATPEEVAAHYGNG
jgi:hypothetical protein